MFDIWNKFISWISLNNHLFYFSQIPSLIFIEAERSDCVHILDLYISWITYLNQQIKQSVWNQKCHHGYSTGGKYLVENCCENFSGEQVWVENALLEKFWWKFCGEMPFLISLNPLILASRPTISEQKNPIPIVQFFPISNDT